MLKRWSITTINVLMLILTAWYIYWLYKVTFIPTTDGLELAGRLYEKAFVLGSILLLSIAKFFIKRDFKHKKDSP